MNWDVFISHAWEDKEDIAKPLAETLRRKGLRVWYDEFTLCVGDELLRSIDHGLANSRYGVVILSPNFFAKEWPQKELAALAAREVHGEKVILPIWHNVTADRIREYSPTLADRVAVLSDRGLEHIVGELLRVIKPTFKSVRPSPMPPQRPSAKPRQPVNWEKVGAIAGVIVVLIALGVWLVPNAADSFFARLFETPTMTPTNSPTHTPVISTATPSPKPLEGLEITYDYTGEYGAFGVADKAKAYDEKDILVGEAQCLGIEEIPGVEVGVNLIIEETQYARDGSGTVVYKGKIIFYTQTGQVTSEETIQGSKRYNIFNSWPMGW